MNHSIPLWQSCKKRVCALCAGALFLLYAGIALAQAPSVQWEKLYGGSGDDEATSIQQTRDGGYIIAGYSNSLYGEVTGNHGGYDYWVVKIDAGGNLEWEKSLGGEWDEQTANILQTTDGGYIVAGYSKSDDDDVTGHHGNSGDDDYWIVKLDQSGAIQWETSLGGTGDDIATYIKNTTDSGYIIAGYSDSRDGDVTGNHGSWDYWIVKIDMTGNIQWENSYGGSAQDIVCDIQLTSDGGYIIAGYSSSIDGDVTGNHPSSNGPSNDYWVVKIDVNGSIQWENSYGGSGDDYATSIKQTNDGGYIVSGSSNSNDGDVTGNPNGGAWIVKLDSKGKIQWEKSYENADAQQIILTSGGEYLLQGNSSIVKLDATGAVQWKENLTDTIYDGNSIDIEPTSDGWYIVTGISNGSDSLETGNHGGTDYWVAKLGPPVSKISSVRQQKLADLLCAGVEFDSTYIYNVGQNTLVIYSAAFTQGNQAYSVFSPTVFPDSIAPGDSELFVVQFAPPATGTFASALQIRSNDTAFGHNPWNITFTGSKGSAGFSTNLPQINFGTVAVNATKDTVLTIYDTGSVFETIQFSVTPPFYVSKNFVTIAGGDSASVNIKYAPTQSGSIYGTICLFMISPCYFPSCIVAFGNSDSAGPPQLSGNALNVTVYCDSSIDTGVYVVASSASGGASGIIIDSAAITGSDAGAFQLINNTFPLTPNPSGTIRIRFTPRHTGTSAATLILYGTGAANMPYSIALTGVKDSLPPAQLNLRLVPESGVATVGAMRKVFVVTAMPSVASSGIAFTVANEPTALQFLRATSACGAQYVSFDNSSTITLTGCPFNLSDTIATLYYQTLVGVTISPSVAMVSASSASSCFAVSGDSTEIQLHAPGCELGTVNVAPFTSSLQAAFPNPATDMTTMTYSTIEDANVMIDVRDALGKILLPVVNTYLKQGVYSATVDTRVLKTGVYFLRMQEGKFAASRELMIMR